jgi:hypothetical protein
MGPRAAKGRFPYPHRNQKQVREDQERSVTLRKVRQS